MIVKLEKIFIHISLLNRFHTYCSASHAQTTDRLIDGWMDGWMNWSIGPRHERTRTKRKQHDEYISYVWNEVKENGERKKKHTHKRLCCVSAYIQHAYIQKNMKHTVQVVSQVQGFHGKPENLLSKWLNEIKMFPLYLCMLLLLCLINFNFNFKTKKRERKREKEKKN